MRYFFALLALAACGDNGSAMTFEQREAAETRARCERLTRCGETETVEACISFFRPSNDASLAQAVQRGIIDFNPLVEALCLDDLAGASCDRTDRSVRILSSHCQGALLGTYAAGASCAFDEECASGQCAVEPCAATQCCMGTCKPTRKAIGGMCDLDTDCVDDAYCSDDHSCVALEAAGGACRTDKQCDFGLACTGATSFDKGTCRKLPALGERCPYERCADINARCNSAGVCIESGLPGDDCTTDVECSQFALCDAAQSKCIDMPTLGQPCVSQCGGDAFCSNGTCITPLENGDECGADNECETQVCAEGPIFDACAPKPVCI